MARVSRKHGNKRKLKGSCGVPVQQMLYEEEDIGNMDREEEDIGNMDREEEDIGNMDREEEDIGNMDREEEDIGSSEEEDEVEHERRRQKLLEAIGTLGGKRKKAQGERSEAAVHMSEFSVNTDGGPGKVQLSDLIGSLEKTPAVPAKSRKQLKNLQRTKKTIDSPLSKQETERIQRDMAFQKAASEVSRWDSIITQNQRAEQLLFPLSQEPAGPRPVERLVAGWKAQTPLEQEVFALLSANKQPLADPILTPAEEASVRAMSLEEAKIRRAELQKARALQSFYEAKARRERKIKSKKYHKVQNKAKRKEFVKHFEQMVKTDPAAALQELNKMELARMQERMSLKHQNSSKWAKSKAIMAKYDEEARKAMQQQLEMNRQLTQKLVTPLDDDEEEEEEEGAGEADLLPDFVNDAVDERDASNPWMKGKLTEEPTQEQLNNMTTEAPQVLSTVAAEEEEWEAEETEEEALLREFDSRRKLHQAQESDVAGSVLLEEETEDRAAADASDHSENGLSEFTSISRGREESFKDPELVSCADFTDGSAQLEERLMRIRTVEDLELLHDEPSAEPSLPSTTKVLPFEEKQTGKSKNKKKGIELKEVLTKETNVIKVPLTPAVADSEDPEAKLDQRGLIKEAFAGDDVISDFLKDKRRQEDEGKPRVIDLTLPGWGEWGGMGLKPPKRKRKRFRVRSAPPPPRKDQHLPSVIISEKRNTSISLHQVHSLPFPFENHAQFESCIRSPLGRAWNTERTVKKVTKPRVVTQLGTIIGPMAEEELLKNNKKAAAREGSAVYQPVTVVTPQGQVVTQALSPGTIRVQNNQLQLQFHQDLNLFNHEDNSTKNKRGVLPKHATNVMRSWLFQHIGHPYPTEDEKKQIASQTNLTLLQVNNWFINARRRILQPMLDASSSETPKTKKKTPQNRPLQRFWPDSIAGGGGTHQQVTMPDGTMVTMNMEGLQSLTSDGATLAVQQVMLAGHSEDESGDSGEDDDDADMTGLGLDNSDSLQ